MKYKLIAAMTCLAAAAPAAAQVLLTPTPRSSQQPSDDQTRPRRGVLTPEEQMRLEQREEQRQQDEGRVRALPDPNVERVYEGRATFNGQRPGKCPLNGTMRATVRGNIIDASLTFPIERDAIHGYISGSRFEARGNFGYTLQGALNEGGITGTVTKKQQVKPSPQKPTGTPLPFIPGPATSPAPPPPPLVQDCSYMVVLNRIS